jgi:hypothetical protein
MKYYLEENPPTAVQLYTDHAVGTCLFLGQEHTSFLIYVGDKTYSSIN